MKKIIIGLTFILIVGFFFLNKEKQEDFVDRTPKEKTRREIASLPPVPAPTKKISMQPVIQEDKRDVAAIEAKSELEEKIIGHYQNIFEEVPTTVSMEFVQDVKIEEDSFASKAKVYKINLDQGQGNKSRFLAMVDPETGSIIKTWNHTRYEFKKPLRISGEGQEFYSEF